MQTGAREIGHGVGQFRELDPVELDVLPRGEVAVVAVVAASDMRQRAQLVGGERAIGDGDAEHIGVQLQIDAVHEPQRLELFFRQFTGQAATHLVAELAHALGDQSAVEVVVDVHDPSSECALARRRDGRSVGADLLAQIAWEHTLPRRHPHRRDVGIDGLEPVGER